MAFFKVLHNSRNNFFEKMPDDELISQYKKTKDKSIIGEFFKRYSYLILGLCLKYFKNEEDARDALMQVFEKVYDGIEKHEIISFKNWIYTVAKNHCLMIIRKNSSYNEVIVDFPLKSDENFVEFYDNITLSGLKNDKNYDEKLMNSIEKLNNEQKLCIELFYLKEKSYKEIADETNYEINQVKSYIQNGKRNLKILLTND